MYNRRDYLIMNIVNTSDQGNSRKIVMELVIQRPSSIIGEKTLF